MHRFGLAFLFLAAALPARAGEDGDTLTIQTENDRYVLPSADRHYTNGLKLSWLSREVDLPASVTRFTDWPSLFVRTGSAPIGRRVGIALGHSIFTPENTQSRPLVRDDRPYAGWAYVELSFHAVHADDQGGPARQDTLALQLGVAGPAAGGEPVQNNWHDVIGAERAKGWNNQLRNEPGANLVFERRWRTDALAEFKPLGLSLDVVPHYGMSIGNVLTAFGAGATLRIGHDLLSDFGPPRIRPSLPGSEGFRRGRGFGWYFFAGAEGRAVARNIFLDGNSFRDGPSVDRKVLVGDFQAGLAFVFENVRLTYTHVFRTKEFDGQPQGDRFGALSLSVRF